MVEETGIPGENHRPAGHSEINQVKALNHEIQRNIPFITDLINTHRHKIILDLKIKVM